MCHTKWIKKSNLNPLSCTNIDKWDFDNFVFAHESFDKALRIFETILLVNTNSCGKLMSSLGSPIIFGKRFKVTSVLFFIPGFSLLSFDLENFTFEVLYSFFLSWYYIRPKQIWDSLTVPFK